MRVGRELARAGHPVGEHAVDERHAENVFIEMPRLFRIPAGIGEMVQTLQLRDVIRLHDMASRNRRSAIDSADLRQQTRILNDTFRSDTLRRTTLLDCTRCSENSTKPM